MLSSWADALTGNRQLSAAATKTVDKRTGDGPRTRNWCARYADLLVKRDTLRMTPIPPAGASKQ